MRPFKPKKMTEVILPGDKYDDYFEYLGKYIREYFAELSKEMTIRVSEPERVTSRDILLGLDPAITVKLEVYDADGEERVRARAWLGKKAWFDVNDVLKQQGFKWESAGKNSYWHRRVER